MLCGLILAIQKDINDRRARDLLNIQRRAKAIAGQERAAGRKDKVKRITMRAPPFLWCPPYQFQGAKNMNNEKKRTENATVFAVMNM